MEINGEDDLKQFAKKHSNVRAALGRWLQLTAQANWENLQDVRGTFPATDYIPQNLYCFDIGGNNYRLVTTIVFELKLVIVRDFMTHAEYELMDAKYFELVKQFQLLPIRDEASHKAAKLMILQLAEREGQLSAAEIGYGEVLIQLIKGYERKIVGAFFTHANGPEILEFLIDEHKMNRLDVAEIAGISNQELQDFLTGQQGLSRVARNRLGQHFKLNAQVFELANDVVSA